MILAHLSDLHVSRFGEHLSSLRSRKQHKAAVRAQKATEHHKLAANLPSADEVERMLIADPRNTNLLFLRAAHRLRADAPDWVLLTGDVTDDAIGYDLVLAALAPFVERGRVLAVPGNHDIYTSPPLLVPGSQRRRFPEKRAAWGEFARALGLPVEGPWLRDLGDGALVVGLDSCHPARTPLSASGAVPTEMLEATRALLGAAPRDALRLAMVHHHVVNLPTRSLGLAPFQLGIRLRNAKRVYEFLCKERFAAVLNGHRHLGYRYHPTRAPLFVSAPSATLGCHSRSTDRPYYWHIEIMGGRLATVVEQPI